MQEFDLIERLLKPLAAESDGEGATASGHALGLSDDAALLMPSPGQQLVLTKDVMVAGVHFPEDENPKLIAQKLLRVNLSDLAAMGATPVGYLLGLIGGDINSEWIEAFVAGLAADQAEFGITLLGGDTVSGSATLTLSLTAIGSVPDGTALMRSGANPGEGVFVTGTIGDGALGLKSRRGDIAANPYLIDRYQLPQPRLTIGQSLRGIAGSCVDISDGLLADAGHIADVSDCRLTIERDRIPLSDATADILSADASLWADICGGGDDYELLFTAPLDQAHHLSDIAVSTGVPVTRIGDVLTGSGIVLTDADGRPVDMPATGFEHKI